MVIFGGGVPNEIDNGVLAMPKVFGSPNDTGGDGVTPHMGLMVDDEEVNGLFPSLILMVG